MYVNDMVPIIFCPLTINLPAAIVNGTLYIYGGQSKTSSDQNSDTWSE
jgi:hypothetical protein